MSSMRIFLSHTSADNLFSHTLVTALRQAGCDVWYDEESLGPKQLMATIQRELEQCPVFIGILSKSAFASRWVQREVKAAFELVERDPRRLLFFVVASPIERSDFNG